MYSKGAKVSVRPKVVTMSPPSDREIFKTLEEKEAFERRLHEEAVMMADAYHLAMANTHKPWARRWLRAYKLSWKK